MVSPLRIVHAITRGDVGGAQTAVVELAAAQHSAGDRVAIVAGTDGQAMERARRAGIEVVIVASLGEARHSVWQRTALRELQPAIARLEPDVVHAHSSNAGLLARIVARRLGVASVYTAHGWPFQRGAPWHQRLTSWVGELVGGRLGGAVICLTDVERARAERARVVRRGRVFVVPNGLCDTEHVRPPGPTDAPRFVMVARFAPPKLQDSVVGVMAGLLDRRWELVFIGDGPQRVAVERRGRELLGERVTFLGERDDVEQLLATFDVMLLWSRYEGMPIALMEGMRAGLACVASDLPGVRELFGEPPAGMVAADDVALRDALAELTADPTAADRWGSAARGRFEAAVSAEAIAARTRQVYATVVARAAS